jgi:hypothetical protein
MLISHIYSKFHILISNYEGYSESKIRRAVNKKAMKKELISYEKIYTYLIKLLLDVVTAGTEALESRNAFLCVCVINVCRLLAQSCFDTFH